MQKELIYVRDNKEYRVVVTYKRIRNTYFRFKNGVFYISAPHVSLDKSLLKSLDKFFVRLTKDKNIIPPIGDDYVYIFGERKLAYLGEPSKDNYLIYKDATDLTKRLKHILLEYLNKRVAELEDEMKISRHYKVRVRAMKTRYGTNSKKTHSLTFSLKLVHFDQRIIDAIIIHELAHDYYFDHSKKFYSVIDRYSPNYKYLHKALNDGKYDYAEIH